jgi:hypothetical protein
MGFVTANDGTQIYYGPFFGNNRPGAKVSQGIRDAFWLQGLQSGRRAEGLRRRPARHHRHAQGTARRRPAGVPRLHPRKDDR